jgi:hypothetical protein
MPEDIQRCPEKEITQRRNRFQYRNGRAVIAVLNGKWRN